LPVRRTGKLAACRYDPTPDALGWGKEKGTQRFATIFFRVQRELEQRSTSTKVITKRSRNVSTFFLPLASRWYTVSCDGSSRLAKAAAYLAKLCRKPYNLGNIPHSPA
jgi:hypothetical protein